MLENLMVTDISVHEIFPRDADRRIVPPRYAVAVEKLSQEALEAFMLRVTNALSAKAKAIEMDIFRTRAGSFQAEAKVLVKSASETDFLSGSRNLVDLLAEAQDVQNIPGGIIIVFRGSTSGVNRPFVGVIKAEVQDGFRRRSDGTSTFTEFVNDLFLTKATRLYKIGFMSGDASDLDDNSKWQTLVYDHAIVASNREAAAVYFYERFLGCGFREDAAYETAKFFNLTKEFSAKNISNRDERHEVQDALYTYVKTEKSPTFTVSEFAERYVPLDIRDKYQSFMRNRHFPERAVKRDTSDLKGKLKKRTFKYGTDILFSASPEAIAEKRAVIETETANDPHTGEDREQTVIRINDPFVKET
ncbi:nucleoid-associated protein [Roseibium alexandrii]|uniref:nucleoid-associated protein n=1 Tax=Roseibium alexandrii TaxID=388408 RepID=UPI0037514B92